MTDKYPEVVADREVLVVCDGVELRAPLRAFLDGYDGPRPQYRIELVLRGDLLTATGMDVFDALMGLREQLEPRGCAVAVQGARRDAWPSGMTRDMEHARRVYIMRPGVKTSLADLVATLADAPVELLGTIAEQEEHRDLCYGRPRQG